MSIEIKVISVNISERKGVAKSPVNKIILSTEGIKGDSHAGKWHRQVSMLGMESIERFSLTAERKIHCGEFAENITTSGMVLTEARPFDLFVKDELLLEVTQIGKECHGHSCNIFKEVGNCVMPKEGIFCRVRKGGDLRPGETMIYIPKVFKVSVITLSDRAYANEYEDLSGPAISNLIGEYFTTNKRQFTCKNHLIPDNALRLKTLLEKEAGEGTDVIITTGGTGIGTHDITIETIKPLLDKEIPGIMEMIRIKYGQEKPNALLTRSIAGVKEKSLVYALPGSVRAVKEYMTEIFKTLEHSFYMLHGIDNH